MFPPQAILESFQGCYAASCRTGMPGMLPGARCYSPTCPQNRICWKMRNGVFEVHDDKPRRQGLFSYIEFAAWQRDNNALLSLLVDGDLSAWPSISTPSPAFPGAVSPPHTPWGAFFPGARICRALIGACDLYTIQRGSPASRLWHAAIGAGMRYGLKVQPSRSRTTGWATSGSGSRCTAC